MDESQRSSRSRTEATQNFSVNEEDRSIAAKLAPVSIKAGNQLTDIFTELSEHWQKFAEIEEGDRLGKILNDFTVEAKMEKIESMPARDVLNVTRFNLRKIETLKEENDMLMSQNRELTEKLHLLEHRVGKAQTQVFVKMHDTVRQVVDDFHDRELDLSRLLEEATATIAALTAKNSKLEGKVEQLEGKLEEFEKKHDTLTEEHKKLTDTFDKLAKKHDEQAEEIYMLNEQLEETKQTARSRSEQAVQEALEAQNLRMMIVREKDAAVERALRHEESIKRDMDAYKTKIEGEMAQLRRRCKDEMEAMTKLHRTESFQQDSRIQALASELQKKNEEVAKFERHLEMMEAQIKGNMKRSLAVNYQEMLNIISAGPSHVPTPPVYTNPLVDLIRDVDKENHPKKRLLSSKPPSCSTEPLQVPYRTSCPPSPKRTIAVQASEPEPPRVVRRPMPPSFLSRKPSTSATHRK